jgi:DNA-binding GntR family transcriptional regulator
MDRFRQLMVAGVEDLPVVIGQHEEIATAIASGDTLAAEDCMRRHLRRIFNYVDEARARFPAYFEESAE